MSKNEDDYVDEEDSTEETSEEENSEEEGDEELEDDDSDDDSEGDSEDDESEEDPDEEDEKSEKKKRKKSTIDRLKERNKKLTEENEKLKGGDTSKDDMDILRLETRGILDSQSQKIVKRAAKVLGVSVVEALEDDLVKSQLEKAKTNKKNNDATVRPKGRATKSESNLSRLVDRAIETGEYPKDKETNKKVREEMARRAEKRR
jgi:hypothetical protein